MEKPAAITDDLLNVYNYAFVETAPYGFCVPKRDRFVAVNLPKKIYHCLQCEKAVEVNYKPRGVVYFSKERFAKQQAMYEKMGLPFPDKKALRNEDPFTYQEEGYCAECAELKLSTTEDGQKTYNLCRMLHIEDEGVLEAAREIMGHRLKKWLAGIDEASKLANVDLSTHEAIRNLLCAVILDDTTELEALLRDYQSRQVQLTGAIRQLLAELPDNWDVYAARPVTIYESMSDEMYHEYTVVFPVDETEKQEFFVAKHISRERVGMFIEQRRIASLEELLMEAGFLDTWIEMFIEHAMKLDK